jgi:hypothetical protein
MKALSKIKSILFKKKKVVKDSEKKSDNNPENDELKEFIHLKDDFFTKHKIDQGDRAQL